MGGEKMKVVMAFVALVFGVVLSTGCWGDYKIKMVGKTEPFVLSVDSLEITGEVDDPQVDEVEVNGERWPVTGGQFKGTVETTQDKQIEIRATDADGNTAQRTIQIR